jgi:hydroxyacylglutathione hydrolase
MSIQIETFPVYPLGCNCSIVFSDVTKEAVLIDPGGSESEILKRLQLKNLSVKHILHTHAHFDHCLGTRTVADKFPEVNICLHKLDLELYEMIPMQCEYFGVAFNGEELRAITHFLQDEEEFELEGTKLKVIFTPGHTPGSSSFYLQMPDKPILFSGDTLFSGGIGRTDLWGGDPYAIMKSIKERLFSLEDETLVIPGHGETTKIYNEKRFNPFF